MKYFALIVLKESTVDIANKFYPVEHGKYVM